MLIPIKFDGFVKNARLYHVGGGVGEAAVFTAAEIAAAAAAAEAAAAAAAVASTTAAATTAAGAIAAGAAPTAAGLGALSGVAPTAAPGMGAGLGALEGGISAELTPLMATEVGANVMGPGAEAMGIEALQTAAPPASPVAAPPAAAPTAWTPPPWSDLPINAASTPGPVAAPNTPYFPGHTPPTTANMSVPGAVAKTPPPSGVEGSLDKALAWAKDNKLTAGMGAMSAYSLLGNKNGIPEEEKYKGPLSRYRFNPDSYRPARSYAKGGIASLGGYSDGGRMTRGPGDGMSDNIPASIEGKRPARLADGEFVVPADVVSHLGNGSTDAGAKRLYEMMAKLRKDRTGRSAQGKQIKPERYMPRIA